MISTDSTEYEILENAVRAVANIDQKALSCEIGLRAGGGTVKILDALWATEQYDRVHIAIDPYGNIEYETAEGQHTRHDYTNSMRDKCLKDLYEYIQLSFESRLNCIVMNLEDTEFFDRYSDGVPVYANCKYIANTYALVHFDGPHALEPLKREIDFFTPRLISGAQVVFDDIQNYDHHTLEQYLFSLGFILHEKGERKASYKMETNVR